MRTDPLINVYGNKNDIAAFLKMLGVLKKQ